MPPRTVYSVLSVVAAEHGDGAALHQPVTEGGRKRYRTYSWTEYETAAREIAAGLRQSGILKGDVVALYSETRAEFYLADLGILSSGAIAAALYTSYQTSDQAETLRACGARAVFVENFQALGRLREALGESSPIQWFLLDGTAEGATSLEELRRLGRRAMAGDTLLWVRILEEVRPEDPAILYLTSGATGAPKMALVTHAALVANMDMGPLALPFGPRDSVLAFLPSAHITQRMVCELLAIRWRMTVWFSASLMSLPHELQSVKPTLFVAPPRFWERVYTSICADVRKRPAAARHVFYAAIGVGLEAVKLQQQGKPLPRWLRLSLRLADRLVFRQVRSRFGGCLKVCASGSAPLGEDLAKFYRAVGLPMLEGYGLTEGGVVILNPPERPKAGSIGKPLPGVEVQLAEDGELLIRSATVFAGYFQDPRATAQVLRDGWLRTGDTAEIDGEGYIHIVGRKKEIIITSNGKKIFPSKIEDLFKLEPIVSHVLLVGDRLPYLTALLTVNLAEAEALKGMASLLGRSAAELALAPPVTAAVEKAVKRVNRRLAPFEQIRKFRILEREFTIDSGELTATLKVRRCRALENFRAEASAMYAGKEESH